MNKTSIHQHFNLIAEQYDFWKDKNSYYYETLKDFYKAHVRPDDAVIEFGCGTGDILVSVGGRRKVGLDLSEQMVERARAKHPGLRFVVHDCETAFQDDGPFDVAMLPDIIDHITDILKLYGSVNRSLRMGGLMCISTVNPLWDPIFKLAERLHLKMPEGEHSFVPNRDLISFLRLRGFECVSSGARMLIPRRIPLISDWINRVAPRLPLLYRLCVCQTIVARKVTEHRDTIDTDRTCSVIIPCYNERDNIAACIPRIPTMGRGTEILVVDDGSRDGTAQVAQALAAKDPRVRVISYTPNRGKGHAVKQGFDQARGDILMILDADMTVMPEELPLFFQPLVDGTADFANGTRMIYPMENQAMRLLNLAGNFFFGVILSWLLSQRVSDTLCGTKALRRADYAGIPMGSDKWGDFDLLFGAAEKRLRIAEIPVHYMARTAGVSKMKPFKHCLVLLKVCVAGFVRLKLKRHPR